MIDELCLRAVDWTVDRFSRWFAPWSVRLKRSGLGFRSALIGSRARAMTGKLVRSVRVEEDWAQRQAKKKDFIKLVGGEEGEESPAAGNEKDPPPAALCNRDAAGSKTRAWFEMTAQSGLYDMLLESQLDPGEKVDYRKAFARMMTRLDGFFVGKQLGLTLLLTMVCACLLAAKGTGELGALAAFFCLQWLASAMDEDYEPVCASVRQRYLAAQLLRAAAYLTVLLRCFASYAQSGLKSNIVLQGAMALTLIVHLSCFLSFAAFNRRQKPFVRALAGLLGFLPALACSAGIALSVTTLAKGPLVMAGSVLRAAGMLFAFLSWEAEMITSLGKNELVYGRFFHGLLMTIGFFLMLAGAWMTAP